MGRGEPGDRLGRLMGLRWEMVHNNSFSWHTGSIGRVVLGAGA